MVLDTVVYVLGSSTLLYVLAHSIMILRLYTRPSSLPRYLHGSGSWALVTGASDGIGFSFAQELLSRGFHVILHGRNPLKLSNLQTQLRAEFPARQVEIVISDASSKIPDMSGIVHTIKDKRLTVLINNVGGAFTVPKFKALDESSLSDIDENINLNIRFPTNLTRLALPVLERNGPALILNMGSIASTAGLPLASVYAAGKAYSMVFSNSLRLEMQLKSKDVEVLGIMVGEVKSAANFDGSGVLVLSSRQMASQALNRVGCGHPVVFGAFAHLILYWILQLLPQALLDMFVVETCHSRAKEEKSR